MPEPTAALGLSPGENVRVRSLAEIFDTLDEHGALDNLPFMPEMMKYCGQILRVDKRADKTCGPDHGLRRMYNTVFLSNARCDGGAHGGCQAGCLIYWKEAWLERVESAPAGLHGTNGHRRNGREVDPELASTVERTLVAATANGHAGDGGKTWRCQATEVPHAAPRMHGWQVDQYVRDARNWGAFRVIKALVIEAFNRTQKLSRHYLPTFLRFRAGQTYPFIAGKLEKGQTPSVKLDLQPGDRVRIKSKEEIVSTLDRTNHIRGLSFDAEMVKYCGRIATVRARVNRLIDEETGKMVSIKSDCIILDGVICTSDYHRLCPRGIYPYWREAWLERLS